MSVVVPARAQPTRPLVRTVRYELVRSGSLRSTWFLLAFSAVLGVVALVDGAAYSGGAFGQSVPFAFGAVTAPLSSVSLVCAAFGALSGGHEFRYGTASTSVRLFPIRRQLLVGKLVGALAFSVVAAVVAITAALLSLTLAGMQDVVSVVLGEAATLAALALRAVAVCGGYAVVGLAASLLVRGVAAGIALPLILAMVVEPIAVVAVGRAGLLGYLYPFTSARVALSTGKGVELLGATGGPTAPWPSLGAFLVFSVVVGALAAIRFQRMSVN